jgi:signal transduction histidine kinase
MIHIVDECGLGLAALAAAVGMERWGTAGLLLFAALLTGLYLRERRLRRLDRSRHRLRRDAELGALNAMAGISSRTFDLDEILKSTAQCTRELFAQHCDILLFNLETGGVTRSHSTRKQPDPQLEELRCMVEQDLSAFLLRKHSEVLTEEDLPLLPPPVQSWIAGRGYQSFIAVVLYSHHKIMGILFISSSATSQFTASDCNLAVAIARQLGNSVEKVLFYEETELAYQSLRNAQEQLLQSEKMSAVGQLIAGVAHELNNPLTAILGYVQLLEGEPIGERAQDYVRKLYLQTRRTHRVVQNLLSFSRQRKPIQSQVDLRRVLEDSLALREFDLKLNDIQVEIHHDPALPFILGDAHQLEQVFLNIINNAVDSIMDLGGGGSLKIRIFSEAELVYVEFRDTGTGIKDPGKIFDPFYTTKKIGKGSGLGLSICYGIVKEHGGDILAFNHEEGGAVLQLKLPVTGPQLPQD